jgi:hypothetical protein
MYKTNYLTAANWFNNRRILMNNIREIDPAGLKLRPHALKVLSNADANRSQFIYSYWLMDCTLPEVQFLEQHFGLLFGYSELLQKYFLCVDHYGTKWEKYIIDTDLEEAAN